MLRHNIWVSGLHCAIRRAGCAPSAEPSYRNLFAPGQRGGVAGLRRVDILAILQGNCIAVLDCAGTHPAAAPYAWGASQEAAYAAALAVTCKRLRGLVMALDMNSCLWC